MRPSLSASWGGPLDGQQRRRQIVRDITNAITFDRVLETGTLRGTSTEIFASVFGVPVNTDEADERFFSYSSRRLSPLPEITVDFADSRQFLRAQANRPGAGSETVYVYLDAHWAEDLPLADELRIVSDSWERAVVMIDDFQVPNDEGYAFDDYGPGKALVEGLLPASALAGWFLHYPAAESSLETGAKRGSCVLSSPAIGPLTDITTLRLARKL